MAIFENFITLKKASDISGYHPDYIGALIRSGKVDGKKVGRNWQVSESGIRKHLSSKHFVPVGNFFFTRRNIQRMLIFGSVFAAIFIVAFFAFQMKRVAQASPAPVVETHMTGEVEQLQSNDLDQ